MQMRVMRVPVLQAVYGACYDTCSLSTVSAFAVKRWVVLRARVKSNICKVKLMLVCGPACCREVHASQQSSKERPRTAVVFRNFKLCIMNIHWVTAIVSNLTMFTNESGCNNRLRVKRVVLYKWHQIVYNHSHQLLSLPQIANQCMHSDSHCQTGFKLDNVIPNVRHRQCSSAASEPPSFPATAYDMIRC
eukprot:TRINITY_DN2109_c0_g1_i3.p1 TRINITY_DN2109_c0_g1~~TRINITY_DN2109_c0_g1_i3.p1  ORF type:complete len:190 (-),score=4.92 TRINITY_DN2109_c0_g1_i3:63-632(-)